MTMGNYDKMAISALLREAAAELEEVACPRTYLAALVDVLRARAEELDGQSGVTGNEI